MNKNKKDEVLLGVQEKENNNEFSLLDYVSYRKNEGVILSLPNPKGMVVFANISDCKLHQVNKEEVSFLHSLKDIPINRETSPLLFNSLKQIRKNLIIDSNLSTVQDYYKTFFKSEDNKFSFGVTFSDFTKLSDNRINELDMGKYSNKLQNPFINSDTYLLINKQDSEHYFIDRSSDDAVLEYSINNLNQNKHWNYHNMNTLLKEYKSICDNKDWDYEFHSVEDVISNEGAYKELLTLRTKDYEEKQESKDILSSAEPKKIRRAR